MNLPIHGALSVKIVLDRAFYPSGYLFCLNMTSLCLNVIFASAKQPGDSFSRQSRCIKSCKHVLGGDTRSQCTTTRRAMEMFCFY